MLGLVGVTVMDTSVAEVTVSVDDPDILPDTAVIVVEPAATAVASPLEPAELLTAATAAAEELQITDVVRSCVVLSENVPVAIKCWFVPLAILGLVGVTAMDTSVAEVTVTSVDPDMLPHFPQILALPECVAVTCPAGFVELSPEEYNPVNLASSMPDATSTADEVQVTDDVRSCVVLSE
jgi:hypothetical protein